MFFLTIFFPVFAFLFLLVWLSHAGNTFTNTIELEFFDAKASQWSDNTLPSGVCLDIVTSDDGESIDESTFASNGGLPTADC